MPSSSERADLALVIEHEGPRSLISDPGHIRILVSNHGDDTVAFDPFLAVSVDAAPSGAVVRRRGEALSTEEHRFKFDIHPQTTAEIRMYFGTWANDEPGCHLIHVEVTVAGMSLTSNTLAVPVDPGDYVDGAAQVIHMEYGVTIDPPPPEYGYYALGLHRRADSTHDVLVTATEEDVRRPAMRPNDRAGLTARGPILLADGLTATPMWLEESDVVAGLGARDTNPRVTLDAWPVEVLAGFRDGGPDLHALVLTAPNPTVVATSVALVAFPQGEAAARSRLLWTAELPADIGTIEGVAATLDTRDHMATALALLSDDGEGVVLSVAERFGATSPTLTFRRIALPDYEAHVDAPPAVYSTGTTTYVAALLRQRGAPTAAWDLVRWKSDEDHTDITRIVPPAEPVSARLAFRTSTTTRGAAPVGAVLADAAGNVTVWPDAGRPATLSHGEPLRIAGDAAGLYVLQLDPAGPRLTPLRRPR